MYKLGLVSVSFRSSTPKEIIAAAKGAGLSCIEWGSDIHAPCDNVDGLRSIAELCRESQVEICSYGTYFRVGRDSTEAILPYIEGARALGTDIIRIWCGDKNSEDYTETEREELFSRCRALAEIAEREGVILCLECHNKTYTNSLAGALSVMEAVSSDHLLMYWQPNQYRSEEENIAYAKAIAPFVKIAHVFNWRGKEKMPLREATEIWRKYLEALGGDIPLLLEFMPDGEIGTLPTEANALFDIVK